MFGLVWDCRRRHAVWGVYTEGRNVAFAGALLEVDKKVLVRDEGQERTGLARYIEELVDILAAVSGQSCGRLHDFYKDQEHDMKVVDSGMEVGILALVFENDGRMVVDGDTEYDGTDSVADTLALHGIVFRVHNGLDIHSQVYVLGQFHEMLQHCGDELECLLVDAGMGRNAPEEFFLPNVFGEHYMELAVQDACNEAYQHVVMYMENALVL